MKPLAIGLAVAMTLRPAIAAVTDAVSSRPNAIVVSNCNDSGAGSLRDAVSNAVSGDTVDMTQTGCSTITLATGAIIVGVDDLTLQGPGASALSIDANHASQAIVHSGAGTLDIDGLTIENGFKYQSTSQESPARGGCVLSLGSVFLVDAEIRGCQAKSSQDDSAPLGGAVFAKTGAWVSKSVVRDNIVRSTAQDPVRETGSAGGGGIYTPGTLTIANSRVSGNQALSPYGYAFGGGVQAIGDLTVKYSLIDGNKGVFGGGLRSEGNVVIENSTLWGNSAAFGGAADLWGVGATTPLTITNSTVSGNTAQSVGGIRLFHHDGRIANSTIAFNSETSQTKYGAGLRIYRNTVDLQSTIIAANTNTSLAGPDDIAGNTSNSSLTGASNLVGYSGLTLPAGTIQAQDPLLADLAFNGGDTPSHAPKPGSPALDAGNNDAGATFDQRGAGHPRVIGAAADIGAFERDPDLIFADGFE